MEDMPGAESEFGLCVREAAKSQTGTQPQRRRRTLTLAVAVLTALAGVAAAYYITRPATEPSVVVCYEAADLDSTRVAIAAPPSLTTDACEQPWLDGTLRSDTQHVGQIPPFVGCVNERGTLWVFPGDDDQLCQDLGLANHEPASTPDDHTRLMGLLTDMFHPEECIPIADAEQRIVQLLTSNDLSTWNVRIATQPTNERPCASFSLDPPTNMIRLVPIPTPPTNGE